MKSFAIPSALAVLLIGSGGAFAAATGHVHGHSHGHDHGAMHAEESATDVAATHSEGTVRRIDAAANTLTIAHGPIENLGMPPMTMAFALSGEASLDGIEVGDRVRFVAERGDSGFVVTAVETIR
jgi:Cu(I)/Ag(I) efflux system periplasmic protein CusF